MARQLRITPQAENDLFELASYIAKDSLRAANGLYDAIEISFNLLAQLPFLDATAGFENEAIRDLRVWRNKRYPNHLIFYRVQDDALIIVRVIHAAQDRDRLFGTEG